MSDQGSLECAPSGGHLGIAAIVVVLVANDRPIPCLGRLPVPSAVYVVRWGLGQSSKWFRGIILVPVIVVVANNCTPA